MVLLEVLWFFLQYVKITCTAHKSTLKHYFRLKVGSKIVLHNGELQNDSE